MTRTTRPVAPAIDASWKPPAWEPADAQAVKALARGEAMPEQQRRALEWIIRAACGTYDFAYRPGENDRDTNVALGRQMVGQQIVKLINLDLKRLREAGNDAAPSEQP